MTSVSRSGAMSMPTQYWTVRRWIERLTLTASVAPRRPVQLLGSLGYEFGPRVAARVPTKYTCAKDLVRSRARPR